MNIVELSKLLNLSTATVSRALNDRANVSPQTRLMVLEKAKEVGFRRNLSDLPIIAGRTRRVQLECASTEPAIGKANLIEFARAAACAVGAHGYEFQATFCSAVLNASYKDMRAVDGVICLTDEDSGDLDLCLPGNDARTNLLAVCTDAIEHPDISYLKLDWAAGIVDACSYLRRLGHRRITYISCHGDGGAPSPDALYRQATTNLHRQRVMRVDIRGDYAEAAGLLAHLLTMVDRPTALITSSVVLGLIAMQVVRSNGLSIPQDMSIIACADGGVDSVDTSMSTIEINPEDAGCRAGEMLVETMQGYASIVQTLPSHLIVRESVGNVRQD
jgi:LacI family transcriptional regulator